MGDAYLTCFLYERQAQESFFYMELAAGFVLVEKQHLRRRERVSLRKYCHVEKANDDSKFVKVKKSLQMNK